MSSGAIRAGRAFVELFADDTKLRSGLKSAVGLLKSFVTGVAIAGAGVAAAGAGIVAVLGLSVKAAVDYGSAIKDASDRTGIAAEELQELKFAAEQSGASFEDLETAIKIMQKQGLGDGVEDLHAFADEIAGLPEPAMQTARAMELFGKGGAKLLPLLKGGSEGIRQLRQEARDLGLVLDGAGVDAAEEFGDQVAILERQFGMLKVQIGSAVIPVLQELMPLFSDVGKRAIEFVRDNKDFGSGIKNTLKDVVTFLRGGEFEKAWQTVFLSLQKEFLRFQNWLDEQWHNLGKKMVEGARTSIAEELIDVWGGIDPVMKRGETVEQWKARREREKQELEQLKKTLREDSTRANASRKPFEPDAGRMAEIAQIDAKIAKLSEIATSRRLLGDVMGAGDAAGLAATFAGGLKRALAQIPAVMQGLSMHSRGTFSGVGIGQSLGKADRLAEKIVENTKRTADGVDKLNAKEDGQEYD